MFNKMRGLFGQGSAMAAIKSFNLGSKIGLNTGNWKQAIGSDVLRWGATGLDKMSGLSNMSLGIGMGAIGGGIYGGISDDTSVLGGMAMGAGLGAGIVAGTPSAVMGAKWYKASRAGGMGMMNSIRKGGKAAYWDASMRASNSTRYIGNTLSKSFNEFSNLKK